MTHTLGTHSTTADTAARLVRYRPASLALLRIGAGLLYVEHGAQKLLGMFGGFGGTPGATAPLASLMGVAGVLELFGGLLIVLGLFTRPVALLLAGEMLVAFFKAHAPKGGVPLENGGEVPLLYLLIFLTLAVLGAGALSIDAARSRTSVDRGEVG
jgi:putative oxidoreductase